LSRSGSAQRGIESDVVRFAVSRPRVDVAAPLALSAGARAAAALLARQPVERRIQPARRKRLANFDFLAPFPPLGIMVIGGRPGLRLRLPLFRRFTLGGLG